MCAVCGRSCSFATHDIHHSVDMLCCQIWCNLTRQSGLRGSGSALPYGGDNARDLGGTDGALRCLHHRSSTASSLELKLLLDPEHAQQVSCTLSAFPSPQQFFVLNHARAGKVLETRDEMTTNAVSRCVLSTWKRQSLVKD